jgi:hypothetical protein
MKTEYREFELVLGNGEICKVLKCCLKSFYDSSKHIKTMYYNESWLPRPESSEAGQSPPPGCVSTL